MLRMVADCATCGCSTFTKHAFKKGDFCTGCSHDHGKGAELQPAASSASASGAASGREIPIWEREAHERATREKAEAEEAERVAALRVEMKKTLSTRDAHPGMLAPVRKQMMGEGGMAMFEVDKVWTCCGVSGAKAPPCATMELSDLHVRCKRCGIYCLSFERETCQYHSGHLNLNAILVSKKYLWSCCTKYAGEDLGCNTVPKHYLP
eukprot:m.79843 g.79843  ORF g.79843 m.79843 type:complete len:208 (+) comp14641_c0_seq2:72-695(+)